MAKGLKFLRWIAQTLRTGAQIYIASLRALGATPKYLMICLRLRQCSFLCSLVKSIPTQKQHVL